MMSVHQSLQTLRSVELQYLNPELNIPTMIPTYDGGTTMCRDVVQTILGFLYRWKKYTTMTELGHTLAGLIETAIPDYMYHNVFERTVGSV